MSRIRTVKPEFWTSEQVLACSPLARLIFIGLWNFCDDNGVHPASYVRLKAEIFPADNLTMEEIKHWIGELITNDLVREYAIDNKGYLIVTGWKQHQRIDKPTYRHPLPQSDLKTIKGSTTTLREVIDNSARTPGVLVDHSTTSLGAIPESSPTDRIGRDWSGKEKEISEVETSLRSVSESHSDDNPQKIFEYWQQVMHHPHAKLDNKRKSKITQALKLGYTIEQLKQAIDGCAKTPHNMGENERHQRYDDLDLILRDASHIERFISHASNPPLFNAKASSSVNDLMAGVCYE